MVIQASSQLIFTFADHPYPIPNLSQTKFVQQSRLIN